MSDDEIGYEIWLFEHALPYIVGINVFMFAVVMERFDKLRGGLPMARTAQQRFWHSMWCVGLLFTWHITVFFDYMQWTADSFLKIVIIFFYTFILGDLCFHYVHKSSNLRSMADIQEDIEAGDLQSRLDLLRSDSPMPALRVNAREVSARAVADIVFANLQNIQPIIQTHTRTKH